MSGKPMLLDLFCGAGGAARGYQEAGFYVIGVDNRPQPRYVGDEFILADAMTFPLEDFDAIHASPPCQGYSIMRNLPWLRERVYPLLIEPTIERLEATGVPYVLENVMGAKLEAGWLCGGMFGLPFYRHRLFATSFFWLQPGHPRHRFTVRNGRMMGARARDIVYNDTRKLGANVGHAAGVALVREAMRIDWMNREEITQAIPPAYTRYIGGCLMTLLDGRVR